MHRMMFLNPSAVSSPARWHLRVLVLLLGITILHVWAGPALSDSSGVPVQPASMTAILQQEPSAPAAPMPADVLHQSPSPLTGQNLGQDALLGDLYAAACPEGHVVATTLCSMVLIVAGLLGLYCFRAMFFLPGSDRPREVQPSIPAPRHSDGVSLLQLSISRI